MSLPGIDPAVLREAKGIYKSLLCWAIERGWETNAFEEWRWSLLISKGPRQYREIFGPLSLDPRLINEFRLENGVDELGGYERNIIAKHNAACDAEARRESIARPIGFGQR